MDGTAGAGRKGIAYLRDYYEQQTTTDAGETETPDGERALVASSPWQG